MRIPGHKRLTIALSSACLVLLIGCAFLVWNQSRLTIRVAWASEQTKTFDEMRTRALASAPAEAVDCLGYVVSYYPSGSKQETGSQLDQVVERERARAIRDIVAYLRTKTGEDLGESPEAWIRKHAKQ